MEGLHNLDLWQMEELGLCHCVGEAWEGTLFLPTPLAKYNSGVSLGIPSFLTHLRVLMSGWWFSPAQLMGNSVLHLSLPFASAKSPALYFPFPMKHKARVLFETCCLTLFFNPGFGYREGKGQKGKLP